MRDPLVLLIFHTSIYSKIEKSHRYIRIISIKELPHGPTLFKLVQTSIRVKCSYNLTLITSFINLQNVLVLRTYL